MTPLINVNTTFEIERVIIIPHNGTFSDYGQKPSFSVILCLLESQNLVQKQTNSEHSTNKCTHQVWIGLCKYFFR